MLTMLAAGALTVLAVTSQSDTTVAVRPGTRLEVDNFAGQIAVTTWDREAVRISATHASGDEVEVDHEGGVLNVGAAGHMGPSGEVEFRLTIPAWMDVELSGVKTSIRVQGAKGQVTAETVDGPVEVDGGAEFVTLVSVQGPVTLRNASGRIEVSSVNAAVEISDASGELAADTVNGDVLLERVDAASCEATTVNGRIVYDGRIRDGGRYSFNTHNGDIVVTVPDDTNALVSVSTFKGEFESGFPMTLDESRRGGEPGHGRDLSFKLGDGSARLELDSFQGTIQLRRPGAPAAAQGRP